MLVLSWLTFISDQWFFQTGAELTKKPNLPGQRTDIKYLPLNWRNPALSLWKTAAISLNTCDSL
jgi:hypothetical protein